MKFLYFFDPVFYLFYHYDKHYDKSKKQKTFITMNLRFLRFIGIALIFSKSVILTGFITRVQKTCVNVLRMINELGNVILHSLLTKRINDNFNKFI